MPKQPGGVRLDLVLSRTNDTSPLYRRIYQGIREHILTGHLAAGVRLPSTRSLASSLGVSRTAVLSAFRQLDAEGFIEARTGDGSYVADVSPKPLHARETAPSPTPAARGKQFLRLGYPTPTAREPFALGLPDVRLFPQTSWGRLWGARGRSNTPSLLGYGDPAGYGPLREAIAREVAVSRGVRCFPEQVIVLSSSQQGLDLCAKVLADPGDDAWVEDPGYPGAHGAFAASGLEVVPVPVDQDGLDVYAGESKAPHPRLVYVTPSHQFPLGYTMSPSRRSELLDFADRAGAWIIEDDYDGEFRYDARPFAALQGLTSANRVIYLGTFTKTVFPSLRLAFAVVPDETVDMFVAARTLADGHPPTLPQAVLADFIEHGHFNAFVRRARAVYGERKAHLKRQLEKRLPEAWTLCCEPAGMHLVAKAPTGVPDQIFADRARAAGVIASTLSQYYLTAPPSHGLVLGSAAFTVPEIDRAVLRLSEAVRAS